MHIIYARISKEDTHQTVSTQLNQISARYPECKIAFCDEGVSGRTDPRKRAGFNRMLSLVKPGDTIHIAALDRIARRSTAFELIDELQKKGVNVVSERESKIDTTTAAGRFLIRTMLNAAEYEIDVCSDRIKAGLQRAKAEGKRIGRAPTEESQRVIELFKAGHTALEVMSLTGMSKASVYRIRSSL